MSLYGSIGTGSLYAACDHLGRLTTYADYPAPGGKHFTLTTTEYRLVGDRFLRMSAHSARATAKREAAIPDDQFAGCAIARSKNFR